jgi:hypothetical protein
LTQRLGLRQRPDDLRHPPDSPHLETAHGCPDLGDGFNPAEALAMAGAHVAPTFITGEAQGKAAP